MSDLPTREAAEWGAFDLWESAGARAEATKLIRAYTNGDLLTREEAANAMMTFLDEHGGDVGQHWPTMEDALAWLEADNG